MTGIATAVADNPLVLQAAGAADPTALLQPYALEVMRDADADFITIMAPDRTRWTHPNDEELGKPYIGSIDAALNGEVFTEITAGTLGPSVRTIAPVKDQSGNGEGAGGGRRDRADRGRGRLRQAAGAAGHRPGPAGGRLGGVLAAGPVPAPGHAGLGPGAAGPAVRLLRIGAPLGPGGRDPDRSQGQGGDVQRPGRGAAGAPPHRAAGDARPIRRRPAAGSPAGPSAGRDRRRRRWRSCPWRPASRNSSNRGGAPRTRSI